MRVLPFVWGTPSWAAARADRTAGAERLAAPRLGHVPARGGAALRARRRILARTPGADPEPIRHWEIWNEENIVTFAEADPPRFATLMRMAGRAIHGADPGAKVILGGFFGRPLQIPPNVASGDFLNRIYRAGNVKPYFDGVALHPYVADAERDGAADRNLRRIMRPTATAARGST